MRTVSSVSLHVGIMNFIEDGEDVTKCFQRVSARRNYELHHNENPTNPRFQRVSARRNYEFEKN